MNAINPDFQVKVVTFSDPNDVRPLPVLPDGKVSRDHILFGVTWATNDEVVAVIENRIQNEAEIRRCKLSDATCETVSKFWWSTSYFIQFFPIGKLTQRTEWLVGTTSADLQWWWYPKLASFITTRRRWFIQTLGHVWCSQWKHYKVNWWRKGCV